MSLLLADFPFNNIGAINTMLRLAPCHNPLQFHQDEHSYQVSASVPGVSAEGLQLTLTDAGTIKLVARDFSGVTVIDESFQLPDDADPATLRSHCVDGMLELRVGKLQPPEPTAIAVKPSLPADANDAERAYEIRRQVPGISSEEVEVTVADGELQIQANSGRGLGRYRYLITLPEDAVGGSATAHCAHGLLLVRFQRQPPLQVVVTEGEPERDLEPLLQLRVPGYQASDVHIQAEHDHVAVKLSRDGRDGDRSLVVPLHRGTTPLHATCRDGLLRIFQAAPEQIKPQMMQIAVESKRLDVQESTSEDVAAVESKTGIDR